MSTDKGLLNMRFRPVVLRVALLASFTFFAFLPATASASEVIERNASDVELKVDKSGQALLSYDSRGKRWNVLVWGAVNAIQPTTARPQVEFKLDYSGGYGTYKRPVWKTFKDGCKPYDGPELQWLVAACKAPDGSYWAVQSWQRMLANYGIAPTAKQSVWELRLSHWKGPLPQLDVHMNWAYKKFHHIFGSFTYLGKPVHGFKSTSTGNPLDTFGRNLYLDTFNSAYGAGLEAREQLPHAQGLRQVLLRLLQARQPARGPRRALSGHDHRPRRDAGHLLGG